MPTGSKYFISIEIPASVSNGNMTLSGKFCVPYEKYGITLNNSQVLKHIVLTVTRGGNYQAVTPFEETVVFPDDVTDLGDGCSGYFGLNVFDYIQFDGEGDYYTLCSLGNYLSNVVKTSVAIAT